MSRHQWCFVCSSLIPLYHTSPVITLLGESEVTIEVGSNYEDAGATAFDNLDGDLTASIITSSNVDTSTVGAYLVTYNVSDSAGNTAIEVTRVVNIVETAKILLNGHVYVTSIDGLILTADDGKCYRLKIIQGPSIQLVEVNCN